MGTSGTQISSQDALNETGGNISEEVDVNIPKIMNNAQKEEEHIIKMKKIEKTMKQIPIRSFFQWSLT